MNFLLTTGMVVSLIILFTFTQKQKTYLHYRILSVIFLSLFFVASHFYGLLNEVKWIEAAGFLITDNVGFLIGPFLYIYIKSLYTNDKALINKHLIHFIPLAAQLVFLTIPFFVMICTNKILFTYQEFYYREHYLSHIQSLYFIIYCVLSLRLLSNYQKAIKEQYSSLTNRDLTWIKFMLIGIIGVNSIDIFITIYEIIYGLIDWQTGYITASAMIFLILYLGYYGYTQSNILLPKHLMEASQQEKKIEQIHHLSNTSEQDIDKLKTQLFDLLNTQQSYLDEDLTLSTLASQIGITDKKLSTLLNQYLHTSFYDLINEYRVKSVKEKLGNPDFEHYTLLAIAFESGFKSKSSFNRIFKKYTGSSPSAYKKTLFIELSQ